jgi:hypothetical protein
MFKRKSSLLSYALFKATESRQGTTAGCSQIG